MNSESVGRRSARESFEVLSASWTHIVAAYFVIVLALGMAGAWLESAGWHARTILITLLMLVLAAIIPLRFTLFAVARVFQGLSRSGVSQATQGAQATDRHKWASTLLPLVSLAGAVVLLVLAFRPLVAPQYYSRPVDLSRRVAEQQLAQREAEDRVRTQATLEREEQVRQHLEEARRLVDSRQFNAANGQIDRVTELDPSNANAIALRERIQAAVASEMDSRRKIEQANRAAIEQADRAAMEAQRVATTPPKVAAQEVDPKGKSLQERYEQGRQALSNGDFAAAVRFLESVVRDDPRYLDAESLLNDARGRQRDTMQLAAKRREVGDPIAALRLYLDAQRLGVANQDDVSRVRARLLYEGTDAFNQARQYYAYGQFDKALPLYQRAYSYLSETDPNRKLAKDRIDAIASRGRGPGVVPPNGR